MVRHDVIIIGAGLAGLCCARQLHQVGVDYRIIDGADSVGGRVRTDRVEGFALDRGFQVLLTAYPECRQVLDYGALDLKTFSSGSLIRHGGRFRRLADPWREPGSALESLLSPAATLADKLRVARLRGRLARRDLSSIFAAEETTTLDYLRREGFSDVILESFFRPFLGGVFLESELETSSRMFEFVFKMFSAGDVAVPAKGMQAIPESIAAGLKPEAIRLNSTVEEIDGTRCRLATGEVLEAEHLVVATDGGEAARLVGSSSEPAWCSTVCMYYDAPEPPLREPILVLDGEGRGPMNNLCVISQVAPACAPRDRALVSISVVGHGDLEELEKAVRAQAADWFGRAASEWRHLRSYSIVRALPRQPVGVLTPAERPVLAHDGVFVCGDHLDNGSINGAMVSGRRAAEAVLEKAAG